MATKVKEFHYDNCKVNFQLGRVVKAFLVALRKGISKETLLALYKELLRKYHQIATDQGLTFVPTGICKAIKSVCSKETASEALKRMLSRLDEIEGKQIAQAQQHAAQVEHSESQQQEIKPKGQQGGYYSTMEAFYAAQKTSEEEISPMEKDKIEEEQSQENLIGEFLKRHHVKAFG